MFDADVEVFGHAALQVRQDGGSVPVGHADDFDGDVGGEYRCPEGHEGRMQVVDVDDVRQGEDVVTDRGQIQASRCVFHQHVNRPWSCPPMGYLQCVSVGATPAGRLGSPGWTADRLCFRAVTTHGGAQQLGGGKPRYPVPER